MASATRIVTGQIDFSSGVDSGRVVTIASPENPKGLRPDQLAWLDNATCRGGGVRTRTGWNNVLSSFLGDDNLFQGGYFYENEGSYPYIIFSVAGRIYRLDIQPTLALTDLTAAFPGVGVNPSGPEKAYFCQGEEFLVIQAGDYVTQPLVWDGTDLRRINDPYWVQGTWSLPTVMLPPGGPMDYYQGRFWVANGQRTYMGGDIVGGPAGNNVFAMFIKYRKRDSILHSTENLYLSGGGAFAVPAKSGSIRALCHTTNLDTALGQSNLFVGTRNTIFSMNVPVDRTTWIASGAIVTAAPIPVGNAQPLQTVAMDRYGIISDRSVVPVNGDLFFQAYDGVRSLYLAIRYFKQWGQMPISHNINRVINFNNRALIHMATGIEFDNRLLQALLPTTTPVGTGFQSLGVLDFDLLTSLDAKDPPAWEGIYEGLDFLQLLEADFGGLQRAFAFVHSRSTGRIQVWELTAAQKAENGDNRITWIVETPAYTWGNLWQFKQLDNLELWLDQIFGTVDIDVYFKEDQDPCWHWWNHKQICAARTSCEKAVSPVCGYLEQPYCAQDRIPVVFPSAPAFDCNVADNRPVNVGYQFQLRLVFKGWCRLRGLQLYAYPKNRATYEGLSC